MTITEAVRATVARAMRLKDLSKGDLAEMLGVTPPWITKFFSGKLLSLSSAKVEALEKGLGVKFIRLVEANPLPAEAVLIGEAMRDNPDLAEVIGGLVGMISGPRWELPFFETQELRFIGEGVTTIVMRWEEGGDPHYGRIGREVVEFLTKLIAAKESTKPAPTPHTAIRFENAAERDLAEHGPQFWVDSRGGVAAGSPIDAVECEPIPVGKEYPSDHYALKVFGQSMEPKIPDGATIIVRELADGIFPKKGTIVVYSDGNGSTLKEFGYRKARAGEDADDFGHVPVLKSLNPAFKDVLTMEGGRLDAVLVEVLPTD